MKKNKGFTLVELLAVIVILAIIMIIAIPAVLNTMETAKKKSMMEFAQKVMNKAEEKYYESITMGNNMKTSAEITAVVYDINKDLGINNTGNYYGYVTVEAMDTQRIYAAEGGGWETRHVNGIGKEIMLLQDDLMLSYSTVTEKEMDLSNINSAYEFNNMLKQANIKMEDIPFKEIANYYKLNQKCNYFSIGVIDGGTEMQVGEINDHGIDEATHATNLDPSCAWIAQYEEMQLKNTAVMNIIKNMKS